MTVRHVFAVDDETALCAALLHDVIEDTTADYDDVLKACGIEIADAVAALTKDMRLPEAEREPAYDAQLTTASWQAKLVKLADVYDNMCDAESAGMLKRAAKKGERAIECAGADPRLQPAIEEVRRMIASLIL